MGRLAAALSIVVLVHCAIFIPSQGRAAETKSEEPDCFEQLERGSAPEISCAFPLRLTDQEQADLKAVSRGYVENVSCRMSIRIARKLIDDAITAADHVFESPEQPVVCTVTTPKSLFDVTATFAPRVVFKGDMAVSASPGLSNVKGISSVISWPVVAFVNRWPSIRSGLVEIVNAYRVHARKRAARK
ncbi:MAG: hypothetical protein NW216_04120 [Hyphomicrobium sp.]|nr:hypothetical protein [Hyphomicrobium sp.]